MKKFSKILAFVALILGGGVLVAHAQGYVPLAPLPGTTEGTTNGVQTASLSTYISGLIKLSIALGSALAVLYAVIGGTQYVAASINPSAKKDALERIQNALIGLAIILSSFLILNSINPDLVNFNLTLDSVTVRNTMPTTDVTAGNTPGTASSTPTSLCPITAPDLSLLDDPDAAAMEAGNSIIWDTSNPTIQANLNNLKAQVIDLQQKLHQLSSNYSVEVTSAYRPYNYQKHLYQLYKAWIVDDLQNNTDPLCADLRNSVGSDYQSHGLGSKVANPDTQNSPHMYGTGVDLSPIGVNFANMSAFGYADINAFMTHEGIGLSWQNIAGDPWHFNLK